MFYDRFTAACWIHVLIPPLAEVLDLCGLMMTQIQPKGYFYFNSSKNTARARIALGSYYSPKLKT